MRHNFDQLEYVIKEVKPQICKINCTPYAFYTWSFQIKGITPPQQRWIQLMVENTTEFFFQFTDLLTVIKRSYGKLIAFINYLNYLRCF